MKTRIQGIKARLAEYVKWAGKGAQILVTYRGRSVALPERTGGVSMVDRGIEEGWITPPLQEGLEPVKRYKPSRTISAVLAEDRG